MSNISLSEVVLTTYSKGLDTLTHILNAAQKHAQANGIDADATYFNARLIDDMLPLSFQVQTATRTVLRTVNRLQGTEEEVWENDEKTFADLYERIEKARRIVQGADAKLIDERANVEVELPNGQNNTLKLSAKASALSHGIPNFFFHLQTAYAILRSKGVPLGKRAYLLNFLAL